MNDMYWKLPPSTLRYAWHLENKLLKCSKTNHLLSIKHNYLFI